jgi:hypothetical protein
MNDRFELTWRSDLGAKTLCCDHRMIAIVQCDPTCMIAIARRDRDSDLTVDEGGEGSDDGATAVAEREGRASDARRWWWQS